MDVKVYERKVNGHRENGTTEIITIRAGLDEINHAMMAGRKNVSRMSSISRTDYHIVYRNGDVVELRLIDAPAETAEIDAWTVASPGTLLHRFTQADKDGRALCNKSFRPHRYGNGYNFKTKAEQQSSEYAHLYTFCPRCEAK